jgi:phage tail-like protein
MSMINNLAGGFLGNMMTGMMDGMFTANRVGETPIPSFYFEVDFYSPDGKGFKLNGEAVSVGKYEAASLSSPDDGMGAGAAIGAMNALGMNASVLGAENLDEFLNPGEFDYSKSFVEVSGLEMGLEGKKTFNEGGYNFPIDLPDKMKNTSITLKRLMRPDTLDDKWRKWCRHTFDAMAYWEQPISTMVVQINVFHPNINPQGDPYILMSIDLFNAYPSKMTMSALNSTSEDLLLEEIEISYSNMTGGYPGTLPT